MIAALADTLRSALAGDEPPDRVLVVGASAVRDTRGVVPAAIVSLCREVQRFGMPMDPGKLLLPGRIGTATVIGLPGCARSPGDNGVDRVMPARSMRCCRPRPVRRCAGAP